MAQEFGMSQADPAASASQQPPQASSTVHILSLLLRLRQCCCHLSLLKKVENELSKQILGTWVRNSVYKAQTDFVLLVSPLRLLTPLSSRVTGSFCPWRSSSVPCRSPPAPRPQARTPKPPCPSMALASPRSCLRTPV